MLIKVKSTRKVWVVNLRVLDNITPKYKQWNLFLRKNLYKYNFCEKLATRILTKKYMDTRISNIYIMFCFMFLRLEILTFAIKNKNTPMKPDYFLESAEIEHVIFSYPM